MVLISRMEAILGFGFSADISFFAAFAYHTVRPHQALGYLTSAEFLARSQPHRREQKCH
jgi:transposase InsO family protein